MSIVTVPKPLRDKLGEEASDSLVFLIKESQDVQRQLEVPVDDN